MARLPLDGIFLVALCFCCVNPIGCGSEEEMAHPPGPGDASGDQGDASGDQGSVHETGGPCNPRSCLDLSAQCGTVLDGCGGTVDCGSCPTGQTCGGAGPNQCGVGECTPKTCVQLNAACGLVSDLCGNVLSCGECAKPEVCGGAGIENQCGCTPISCASVKAECGTLSDGCGGVAHCGSCPKGMVCGGKEQNRCGPEPCTPKTCASIGANCGAYADGCDGVIDCGTCVAPQTCGGGKDPFRCGCTPTTCVSHNAECGTVADGCGGTLSCGTCKYGTCQGNRCVCAPVTCASSMAECGTIDDGCGKSLSCGSCKAPRQCGAAGVANQCSCTPAICPPIFADSFESGNMGTKPTGWQIWHNCHADNAWFVEIAGSPAPGGGFQNLRFQTTKFSGSCSSPGAYAQTDYLPVIAGRNYQIESWSRNWGSHSKIDALFYSAQQEYISMKSKDFPADSGSYKQNPSLLVKAPANASFVRIRVALQDSGAALDFDRLELFEE
ncbi:MAG TPA: hypothetical protein PLJ27_11530 [Polyangiaceae bacterium]|nr:MAG: hypothetical protein BWY17_03058 [Deltaproteobacteria bacterium ADurb.Bin207]HQK18083.1 hypothetical protein [Polyangiaceae bacterium]HQM12010.1 hypothetical protein [Polyangiaceae bacterium]